MAKGSHKTWGGWETRRCWKCGRRVTLGRDHAAHHLENNVAFTLCGEHLHCYAEARAELLGDPDLRIAEEADQADRIHPDQLTIDENERDVYVCSGGMSHLPACGGTCGTMDSL